MFCCESCGGGSHVGKMIHMRVLGETEAFPLFMLATLVIYSSRSY